eukprot:TRINITY_DN14871_c0_g5_i2.p1 TRINITY_DN14871_c0_g5~~TRINITY_DN14871_c0_g5_i2.p1  ORF type:complete len:856 (+),score=183.83 TRINITY_DN14871_c0_g5_i2:73-2640(+)
MHGRVKKDVIEPTPEEREKQREHVRTARSLFQKLLGLRRSGTCSKDALDLTARALQFHPEFPTLWGYRRELLLSEASLGSADAAVAKRREVLQMEMKLLERALRKSQKVYSIWFHRKWVLERLVESCGRDDVAARKILDTELELCSRLLEVDERNFHCWNHRAHALGLVRRRLQQRRAEPHPGDVYEDSGGCESGSVAGRFHVVGVAEQPAGGAPLVVCRPLSGDGRLLAWPLELWVEGDGVEAQGGPQLPADVAAAPLESRPSREQKPPRFRRLDSAAAAAALAAAGIAAESGAAAAGASGSAAEEASSLEALDAIDLKLSTDLINRNFSNYSAWHLRALLQQDALDAGKQPLVEVDKELEWVLQGIYTEPNDQSVWLYHHWLTTLRRGQERPRLSHCALIGGELQLFFSGPVCCTSSGDQEGGIVAATRAQVVVKRPAQQSCGTAAGGDAADASAPEGETQAKAEPVLFTASLAPLVSELPGRTRQQRRHGQQWALAWRLVPEADEVSAANLALGIRQANVDDVEVEISLNVLDLGSATDGSPTYNSRRVDFAGPLLLCDPSTGGEAVTSTAAASFCPPSRRPAQAALEMLLGPPPDAERVDLLQGELSRVEELLEIEEDGCKWALLAKGRLATAVAAGQGPAEVMAAERACEDGYKQIESLDPLRRGFYEDARAHCQLRLRILARLSEPTNGSLWTVPLDVSSIGLRNLAPATMLTAIGIRVLNLEGNELKELGPVLLLHTIEELLASRNRLTGDVGAAFVLPRLRRLDVSCNQLSLCGSVEGARAPPPSLQRLDISGNAPVLKAVAAADGNGGSAMLERFLTCAGDSDASSTNWRFDIDTGAGKCVCHRDQ